MLGSRSSAWADKMQIMMVPMDGRYFFANDLLRGAFGGQEDGQAPAPQASASRASSRR